MTMSIDEITHTPGPYLSALKFVACQGGGNSKIDFSFNSRYMSIEFDTHTYELTENTFIDVVMNDAQTFTVKNCNFKNIVNFVINSRGTVGTFLIKDTNVNGGYGAISLTGIESNHPKVTLDNVTLNTVQYVLYAFNFVDITMTNCWNIDLKF
jgi:hypothetical protein